MSSILVPLRNYCERTADELWSEPFNALTNISFFIAAWLLWKLYRKQGGSDHAVLLLIFLIILVGTGSTLFHTFANPLTMMADVIPIVLFTLCYLWLALQRLLKLTTPAIAFWLAIFTFAATQIEKLPPAYHFNGSISYIPCLVALLIISALLQCKRHPAGKNIFLASVCFMVSITFRSVDYLVCPDFSIGTHFLWHCLNGILLYLLTRVFIPVSSTRTETM